MNDQQDDQTAHWRGVRRRMGLALVGMLGTALVGCGSSEPATPTVSISGPALLYFYTDG